MWISANSEYMYLASGFIGPVHKWIKNRDANNYWMDDNLTNVGQKCFEVDWLLKDSSVISTACFQKSMKTATNLIGFASNHNRLWYIWVIIFMRVSLTFSSILVTIRSVFCSIFSLLSTLLTPSEVVLREPELALQLLYAIILLTFTSFIFARMRFLYS